MKGENLLTQLQPGSIPRSVMSSVYFLCAVGGGHRPYILWHGVWCAVDAVVDVAAWQDLGVFKYRKWDVYGMAWCDAAASDS